MRKSEKELPIPVLFPTVVGTYAPDHLLFPGRDRFSLVRFDELKEEDGYAGAIEVSPESMASSHQIKRFFYGFSLGRIWLFRRPGQQVFLWRLWRTCSPVRDPEVVVLGMDTEARDNDDADAREGG
jgi:hypothetical protein